MSEQYAFDINRIGGFDTLVASGGREAMDILSRTSIDCVILDLEMPGMDGFAVLQAMTDDVYETPVIVYTGAANYERCVRAVNLGAYSFLDKEEPVERVVQLIRNAIDHASLKEEYLSLKQQHVDESELLGGSASMVKMKDEIARVAPVPSPVLILGESGSGKEVVAREIHRLSTTPDGPFFAVNCGALPPDLVESELFGHERGAFTGANRTRKGAFQLASGGTIFLDEIGELPPPAQAALLRVLEQREIMRVGGDKPIKIDARVVAATHRDLDAATRDGSFRQDLLFRLNVHVVNVPSLRDRASDIPELADHFARSISRKFGIRRRRISPDATAILVNHTWERNNVRELRNVIERMIIASDDDLLDMDSIPEYIMTGGASSNRRKGTTFQERKADAERQIVIAALDEHGWHITNTAAALGLADHSSLLKIMRRHNIEKPQ